jgi:multidrug efflux system outer membrane protein
VDLWGRVRRSFEAARAEAEVSVSDYQNVLLTLTADVATNYFLIRSLDSEIDILRRTAGLRSEYVSILNDRFRIGTIPEIDVESARAELASSRADLADVTRRRAETLNALALLCGRPASSFEVGENGSPAAPPMVPVGLPSSLLERRPDVAAAERKLAAANARIGAAKAAYFPVLHLTGQAGYLSARAQDMFDADTRVWSFGPGISLPLFTGGRITAQVEQARAVYGETLAGYRQTVLTAFKEVEDSLAQIVLRAEQAERRAEAVNSAARVAELARARYEAGIISYLAVVDAERTLLEQERIGAQIEGQRFVADVRLIKSMGGGWGSPDD